MYCCLECGRKFRTESSAERAVDEGCPKCGGTDIDLDTHPVAIRHLAQIDAEQIDLRDEANVRPQR